MIWKLNETKARQRIAVISLTTILLIVGYSLLIPRQTATQPHSIDVTIIVKNNKRVSGPSSITARQGDKITINIKTDRPDEFHLHGYDDKLELTAAKKATLMFAANLSGQFDYELEQAGVNLGKLRVDPS